MADYTYTVYVKISEGVYRIDGMDSGYYLAANSGALENARTFLQAASSEGLPLLRQCWRITYLASGYYVIRPMHNQNMALHAKNGVSDVTTIGYNNTLAGVPAENRWTIEYLNGGYVFKCQGNSSQALRFSSNYPGASVYTGAYNLSYNAFKWYFEASPTIAPQVLLLDTQTGEIALNTTRSVEYGELVTLDDLGLVASFACSNNSNQEITWSSLTPSQVEINTENGSIRGMIDGGESTITASQIYSGLSYGASYLVYVTQPTVPVLRVKNYYDQGYNVRVGNALTAIQGYHDVVNIKFENIFGIRLIESIEMYSSRCDACKISQYGAVTAGSLDLSCSHSPKCLNTASLRTDILTQKGAGNDTITIVAWTGHQMSDYENDRSNSSSSTNSVIITPNSSSSYEFTLLHELSHQLGAHDHYCYGTSGDEPCDNEFCDECCFGYAEPRECVMGKRMNLSAYPEDELYCDDCIEIISSHTQDHH